MVRHANGSKLNYTLYNIEEFANISKVNDIGSVIANEQGYGLNHLITYTPGIAPLQANFGPVEVTRDHYFLLGDNRDNSVDSRMFGLLHRDNIYGKYMMRLTRK